MSEPTAMELTVRLKKLETHIRWLKWSVALIAIVWIAGLITFAKLPRVSSQPLMGQIIEAEQLVIKDSTGRVRAVLGRIDPPSSSTEPIYGLSIQGQDGDSEARLTDWNLHIHHDKGLVNLSPISVDITRHKTNVSPLLKRFVKLNKQNLTKQEETELGTLSMEFEPVAKFYLNMASPYLEITRSPRDQEHSDGGVVQLGVTAYPSLELRSLKDQTSLSVNALKDAAGMSIRDSQGNRRASFNVDSTDGAAINLYDKDGKTIRATFGNVALQTIRTGGVQQRPASSLVLFDKDGKVMWSTPHN